MSVAPNPVAAPIGHARTAIMLTCACLVALLATAVGPSAAAGPTTTVSYVAMGDSFTSGPLIPNQVDLACARSDHNYPHLFAAQAGLTLHDVSCGGAVTNDMTTSQFPWVAPQFDALRPDTGVVSISIGGNDVGFGEIVITCGLLGTLNPFGHPCTDYYTRGGTDKIATRLAALEPTLVALFQGIHQRSPHARVLVVGVPDTLPLTGSCLSPNVPFAPGDYPYMIKVNKAINATYAAAAAEADAQYVDIFTNSIGHDVCKPVGTRWVEGLIPGSFAATGHPNKLGMAGAAQQVTKAYLGIAG